MISRYLVELNKWAIGYYRGTSFVIVGMVDNI